MMRKFKGPGVALAAALLATSLTTPALAQSSSEARQVSVDVSAKAWVAVDNPSGKLIAQDNGDEQLKVGGFPKLMTAILVARLAAADPKLLDEKVEIASYMVKIAGTKTGARAGDSMTVRDALYGMLVGSANDAALALSQQFNDRFAKSDFDFLDRIPRRSRSFIAEMNRTARKLGMTDTIFRSAYIDGGKKDDRTSTARDLARLGVAVMADPLLREIVGAKSYRATIFDRDGESRSQTWNNHNRLIGSPGVGGVLATGTPSSGQSLILAEAAQGRDTIIVVLGSSSASRRAADAKAIAAAIK